MITAKQAFEIFIQKNPNGPATQLADFGSFYFIDNAEPGDTVDKMYKIDKETGKIFEMDIVDYMDEIRKYGEEDPPIYTFDELKKRAS